VKRVGKRHGNIHRVCGIAADEIMQLAMKRQSFDNLSVIIIGFRSLSCYLSTKVKRKHRSRGIGKKKLTEMYSTINNQFS